MEEIDAMEPWRRDGLEDLGWIWIQMEKRGMGEREKGRGWWLWSFWLDLVLDGEERYGWEGWREEENRWERKKKEREERDQWKREKIRKKNQVKRRRQEREREREREDILIEEYYKIIIFIRFEL